MHLDVFVGPFAPLTHCGPDDAGDPDELGGFPARRLQSVQPPGTWDAIIVYAITRDHCYALDATFSLDGPYEGVFNQIVESFRVGQGVEPSDDGSASSTDNKTPMPTPQPISIEIPLGSLADSGGSGRAVLVESDDGFEVIIEISSGTERIQPAAIVGSQPHDKQCEWVGGGVTHPLNDVSDGRSVTHVEESLYAFGTRAPYVIVVYRSVDEPTVPVTCGVINHSDVIPEDARTRALVTPGVAELAGPVVAPMDPIFHSAQTGRAIIREHGNGIEVTLEIDGQPPGVHQPANIRWNQPYNWCNWPTSGGIMFELNDVVEGRSTTVVPYEHSVVGGMVIVVYRSHQEPEIPVACGAEFLPVH
jgi:hypothetical protein